MISSKLSQFNTPFGCAVDTAGRVYVADRNNGERRRRLELSANRCRTILQGLAQPVDVVDATNIVYVLTQGDGVIRKVDRGVAVVLVTGLNSPTAMVHDGEQSLYVAQNGGTVVQVNVRTKTISTPVLTGLKEPSGRGAGYNIYVSELGRNVISIWDPRTEGWSGKLARGGPRGLKTGRRRLLVSISSSRPRRRAALWPADRGNGRVRLVDADSFVSTLYGVDPNDWEGPTCTSCNPIILPGWFDGPVEFAEARDPVGVTVSADGKIYTTEVYYHLVREITGAVFTPGGNDGGNSTNIVVLAPTISPVSGYYPMGQSITVFNPNSSTFLPSAVYYTTDGTEPTTNSLRVAMTDGVGRIPWQEKRRDLTSLRVKAFLGANESEVVSGQPVGTTEIGVPQDLSVGLGSTAILPVVVNLGTNDQLKSLQFRIEITPESASAPLIPDTYQPLAFSTNDFVSVYSGGESQGVALIQYQNYQIGRAKGMAITFVGTNANFSVQNFGVVSILSVPIPKTAALGSRYFVDVLNASGTADGEQSRVVMQAMPRRVISVGRAGYLVGDSSPGNWYNARPVDGGAGAIGFGDGILDNSDANNVFAAMLGNHVPYPNTDAFDAMDAFPEDTIASAGGDGLIRFLDWQVIFMRSLGLDSARWERIWSEGGELLPKGPPVGGTSDSPGQRLTPPAPGAVWTRQVTLAADAMGDVVPGAPIDVPIRVTVAPGCQLSGLAFRATVEAQGTAPVLEQPAQFVAGPNLAGPSQSLAAGPGTVLCGWPIVPSSSFEPPLQGSHLLGYLRVMIPYAARRGNVYTVRFANADGSPDLQTQYDFDTKPANLWVLNPVQPQTDASSDEWKVHFFGSLTNPQAEGDADPDHDGVPNWAEYATGTHPLDAHSYLHLEGARSADAEGVQLRWLSAPGKIYQIESAPSVLSASWDVLASNLVGDGRLQQWLHAHPTSSTCFYRIRLQP
ncbi:MAG: chitobiase/beta-hexosaminidase C-terminal domain-containing protein [Verrucomicrobiota bacterium]